MAEACLATIGICSPTRTVTDDYGSVVDLDCSLELARTIGESVELPWQVEESMNSSLRGVGAVFTMTLSGSALLAGTSSLELGELAYHFASDIVDTACNEKRVWFRTALNMSLHIEPYGEVYGMHPKFFNFAGDGRKELTMTGRMMQATGLSMSGPLRTRSCSTPSSSRRKRKGSTPVSSLPAVDSPQTSPRDDAVSKQAAQLAALGVPADTDVSALLTDAKKAVDIFQRVDVAASLEAEKNKGLLKERVEEAKTLGEDMTALRTSISETRVRLGALRAEKGLDESLVTSRTMTPEELAILAELETLRASFQDKTWELWEAKKEAERLQQVMQEETTNKQQRFEAWFSSLRKALKGRGRGASAKGSTGAIVTTASE
eukprot:TRINITY_DN25553_c0_g1_i1.p1 TRINITY_DN25553_c0_g1~~TRINITY_DN25553_c0_g1_i1.p1  ORF type:complete len:400 (+),score=84.97 TRINITY_DN25553_c0_g1_i1:73-1200(+)